LAPFNECPKYWAWATQCRKQGRVDIDQRRPREPDKAVLEDLIEIHDEYNINPQSLHLFDNLFRIDIGCLDQSRSALICKTANRLQ
jgi:hypothetical protein